jgi:hypothetical protein
LPRLKTFGRVFSLLGFLLAVLALPGQENGPLPRLVDRRAPAPTPAARARPTPAPAFGPITTLDGSDTCTAPPVIAALPFNDTGTTSGKNNSTGNSTLKAACAQTTGLLSRLGPDVVYSFTILGPGNTLTFTVTPGATYDPAIYVTTNCFVLNSCVDGSDQTFNGQTETLTVSGLPAGTYFFSIDSSLDPTEDPDASGSYSLNVIGDFGSPSNPTATPTRTPTPSQTPTNTLTPTSTPTRTATGSSRLTRG